MAALEASMTGSDAKAAKADESGESGDVKADESSSGDAVAPADLGAGAPADHAIAASEPIASKVREAPTPTPPPPAVAVEALD